MRLQRKIATNAAAPVKALRPKVKKCFPIEIKICPDEQLKLTETELNKEFNLTLTSINPDQPPKITTFNFHKGEFVSYTNTDHLAIHFNLDGVLSHVLEIQKEQKEQDDSNNEKVNENNEAQGTDGEEKTDQENGATQQASSQAEETVPNEQATEAVQTNEPPNENAENPQEKEPEKDDSKLEKEDHNTSPHKKLVKNQFNYGERASQTFNHPMRDREVMTEPPPTSVFSHNASTSSIYEAYLHSVIRARMQSKEKDNKVLDIYLKKEKERRQKKTFCIINKMYFGEDMFGNSDNTNSNIGVILKDSSDALLHSQSMLKALGIMERVVGQNSDQNSYHEFKYYKEEDLRERANVYYLLHLWTFKYHACSDKMITSLDWNSQYHDLFAVGYGSYNFHKQTHGMVCVYSLKSTRHPVRAIRVESGVMCLHFHPKHSSLLCVGAYDGGVAVYDIRNRDDTPIYSSEIPQLYHSDPVWDVRWHAEQADQPSNFYSISSDGVLKNWLMSKNELNNQIVMEMKQIIDENRDIKDEELTVCCLASCSCFDFNPNMKHIFLVGTEDGGIYQCNKAFKDGYVRVYQVWTLFHILQCLFLSFIGLFMYGHTMNVYAVRWNPFHPKTFLSASADWTVKLWDSDESVLQKKNKNNKHSF
ncbi:hypothetical protein RFI_01392 [Reticulomyxa filosa]|uniref:Uncharacterized protein n=1 Tax=Reticulomyxa filosa TaxID=46433 RepID=X6PAV1_RETFI|nr:hypothetical protein RFI_01392 [Reticulomyxa filosa]|eukprot:ETO35670.1 hypothetical protein RFI_01392 [Reticulomyxa filosa]